MSFFVSRTEVCFSKRRHGREKKVCPPEQDLYVSLKKLAFIWYGKMIVNPCKKEKTYALVKKIIEELSCCPCTTVKKSL